MPLVDMQDMLGHVSRHGYTVGAFGVVALPRNCALPSS